MWLTLAFTSAALLGFYDVAKKKSLTGNAVLPVLLLNTLFFVTRLPSGAPLGRMRTRVVRRYGAGGVARYAPCPWAGGAQKSVIVLTSWIFGYFAMKHLPITIVGPINATRPVMVLVGAMLIFGERLNACQWTGVVLALVSLFLLSRSSRREGVVFTHNLWILCIALAAVTGAVSGLYDKYIMARLDPVFVQSWYNLYQFCHDGRPDRRGMVAEAARLHAFPLELGHSADLGVPFAGRLRLPVRPARSGRHDLRRVSMVRRGSVVVSFACGALLFRERNLRAKAVDLILILVGMVLFLWLGFLPRLSRVLLTMVRCVVFLVSRPVRRPFRHGRFSGRWKKDPARRPAPPAVADGSVRQIRCSTG